MSLADRLAPLVTEVMGGAYEKKPAVVEARRKLLAPARGRVLEIGAGTGFNLPHYPPEGIDELVVTDRLDGMLRRARKRAGAAARSAEVVRAPVESLPYPEGSFDTVVASFVLCSVDDQERALAEIRRVLRPGGRYLFFEHVRADDPKLARAQDRMEGIWKVVAFGCHPNRNTLSQIEATFAVEDVARDQLPFGPKIIRPYVIGQTVKA